MFLFLLFFFSSRRRHTRCSRDWSSDVCSSDLLGSLPGHVYANVRQPPVSTLNIVHMIPLSAVWAGPARDAHLGAPPLFFRSEERRVGKECRSRWWPYH